MADNIENVITVIDYIEDHLAGSLDLNKVAGAVHYSKYHLHRMFVKEVGMTDRLFVLRHQYFCICVFHGVVEREGVGGHFFFEDVCISYSVFADTAAFYTGNRRVAGGVFYVGLFGGVFVCIFLYKHLRFVYTIILVRYTFNFLLWDSPF